MKHIRIITVIIVMVQVVLMGVVTQSNAEGRWYVFPYSEDSERVSVVINIYSSLNGCKEVSSSCVLEFAQLLIEPCPPDVTCSNGIYESFITSDIFGLTFTIQLMKDTVYTFSGFWTVGKYGPIGDKPCGFMICSESEQLDSSTYPTCGVPVQDHSWGKIKAIYR